MPELMHDAPIGFFCGLVCRAMAGFVSFAVNGVASVWLRPCIAAMGALFTPAEVAEPVPVPSVIG